MKLNMITKSSLIKILVQIPLEIVVLKKSF